MAGQIPKGFIDDLLARLPIVDVVSSRVTLKKAGTSYKACCPFHNENTPSFVVNAQKNFYHCFGCGVNGNAINFLRDYENLSFNEAVEELAKLAGVEVPRDERVKQIYDNQKKIADAAEYADSKYREALKSHPERRVAKDYLSKRGLSDEVIQSFGVGFAPAQKDFLSENSNPTIIKGLLEAKLVSQKYERPFDLFQNRLMFPIRNMRGKTVGFGGRTLGDDKAKYINSPESPLFHKSSEVYGLYEVSKALRSIERLLVVEGYMDVVSLAQYGIHYAVATLGTATNNENLTQLLKRSKTLIFCFDGDRAGLSAARKAMENLLPLFEDGFQISFLILPEGEDPDTLVRQEGAKQFEARVDRALPLSEFFFQIYSEGLNLEQLEHRGVLRSRARELLDALPKGTMKSGLWDRLNELTSSSRFQKKTDRKFSYAQRDLVENKVLRTQDAAICVGLYYAPEYAKALSLVKEQLQGCDQAIQLSAYIVEHDHKNQEDFLFSLATDHLGFRDQFSAMFSRLERIPSEEDAIEELKFIVQRLETKKKRDDALRATKLKTLPSQLTVEERARVQSVSSKAAE